MSLEGAQDALAKKELDLSSDEDVVDDKDMATAEAKTRGRKRQRPNDLGSDEEMKEPGSKTRSLTAGQRTISAKKIVRDRSASRREGSVPARLPYKLVPEEQVRLSKKIIHREFKHSINQCEADRHVATKRPKYLFSGKMSKGTSHHR